METHPGKLAARPPRFIEAIVERTLPPACREHVLGDMREEYVSRFGYLRDVAHTVPFIMAERIRRALVTPPADALQTDALVSRRVRLILAATLIPLFLAPDPSAGAEGGPHPGLVLIAGAALAGIHWLRQTAAWHVCARALLGALLVAQAGTLFLMGLPGDSPTEGLKTATLLVLMLGVSVFWIHHKNPFSEKK